MALAFGLESDATDQPLAQIGDDFVDYPFRSMHGLHHRPGLGTQILGGRIEDFAEIARFENLGGDFGAITLRFDVECQGLLGEICLQLFAGIGVIGSRGGQPGGNALVEPE